MFLYKYVFLKSSAPLLFQSVQNRKKIAIIVYIFMERAVWVSVRILLYSCYVNNNMYLWIYFTNNEPYIYLWNVKDIMFNYCCTM